MKAARTILVLMVIAVVAGACASKEGSSPLQVNEDDRVLPSQTPASTPHIDQPSDGDTGQDFSIETFDGSTFTMSDHRGSPVVLNFWESW